MPVVSIALMRARVETSLLLWLIVVKQEGNLEIQFDTSMTSFFNNYSPKYGSSSSSQSSNKCIEKDDRMSDYNNGKMEDKAAISQGNSSAAVDTVVQISK